MARRTAEDTKRLMLSIGADLAEVYVHEAAGKALTALVADVRVSDVVAAAGTTTGALYHIWPTQQEYQLDLLLYILGERATSFPRDQGGRTVEKITEEADDAADDVLGVDLANAVWEGLRESDSYLLFVGAFALVKHPDVRQALRAAYDRSDEEYLPVYEYLLDAYGRRMRPGLTVRDLAVTVTALVEGFTLRWHCDPQATREGVKWVAPDGRTVDASLFTLAANGIVAQLTEPATD